MNTYRVKQLVLGCLFLWTLALFALSISAQTPSEGDQFIYLPIIVAEEETVGTIPTRTPTP